MWGKGRGFGNARLHGATEIYTPEKTSVDDLMWLLKDNVGKSECHESACCDLLCGGEALQSFRVLPLEQLFGY